MKTRCLITHKSSFNFPDEKDSSRQVQGAKLQVMFPGYETTETRGTKKQGQKAGMLRTTLELIPQVTVVPGVYEVDIDITADSSNEMGIRANSFKLISVIPFDDIIEGAEAGKTLSFVAPKEQKVTA